MGSDSPPPTTRQIAELAGVSHVTVSRVLRNQQFIKPETRARVLKAADQLGYRPNPLLGILMHQLRSGKAGRFVATIAWVNSQQEKDEWRQRPWRRKVIEGAERRAAQLGYAMDEFWTGEPGMTPQRLKKIFMSRNIYGAIYSTISDLKFLNAVDSSDLALSVIGQTRLKHDVSFVDADTATSMVKAVGALRSRGYRRIGLALAPTQDLPGHPWRATFLSLQEDWGKAERIPPLRLSDTLVACGREYQDWLRKVKPDVVIGCDALLRPMAEEIGLKVPRDLGIAHLHLADDVHGWSGIDTGDEAMGSTAVDVVAAALQRNELGPPAVPKRILVPVHWVDGDTTLNRL